MAKILYLGHRDDKDDGEHDGGSIRQTVHNCVSRISDNQQPQQIVPQQTSSQHNDSWKEQRRSRCRQFLDRKRNEISQRSGIDPPSDNRTAVGLVHVEDEEVPVKRSHSDDKVIYNKKHRDHHNGDDGEEEENDDCETGSRMVKSATVNAAGIVVANCRVDKINQRTHLAGREDPRSLMPSFFLQRPQQQHRGNLDEKNNKTTNDINCDMLHESSNDNLAEIYDEVANGSRSLTKMEKESEDCVLDDDEKKKLEQELETKSVAGKIRSEHDRKGTVGQKNGSRKSRRASSVRLPSWMTGKESDDCLFCSKTYPSDSYSFLSLYGPYSGFFYFGIFVWTFQIIFLILMVLRVAHPTLSMNGEVDNPGDCFVCRFTPSNVTTLTRGTEFCAMLAYCFFVDASLKDVILAVETFPRFSKATESDKLGCMAFSCILRFLQGALCILVVLLLIITSDDVIEIILNFTAVNFISDFATKAFELAKWGKYGPSLEEEAKKN